MTFYSLDHQEARDVSTLQFSVREILANAYRRALDTDIAPVGMQLSIDSPDLAISFGEAIGFTARGDNPGRKPLTVNHPLRVASNTKTFIAAAILRLWEEQQVSLDDSITNYISCAHTSLLQSQGYALPEITVRHLLTHTSGLFDYADSPAFSRQIHQQPLHHWTRTEQIQLAMSEGKPYGPPGDVFRYCDTGYILLGEIIENATGNNLGAALRELLDYSSLGLNSTWLEKTEVPPEVCLAAVHQYDGDLDSYALDASFDIYGGGGLMSTVGDLARFMRGLFTGQVYRHPQTLATMLTTVNASRGGPTAYGEFVQVPGEYRMGIECDSSNKVYSHKGYFGSYAAYIPSLDLSMALSINQHGGDSRQQLITAVLELFDIKV